jgi:hypothetical protein
MSYCRFRNTLQDFQDCLNVLDDNYELANLSKDERDAFIELAMSAQDFAARIKELSFVDSDKEYLPYEIESMLDAIDSEKEEESDDEE